ncbi:PAS domain-containing sensor histidine kinase [Sediminitomix flava]|uniref:histidine kinase n=1 Tax=Sediminitomix flava TaxID=379075 RepID=A0A315ZGU4_SEDFL|nr:PAS domain-containing sensor histidine kinase [Sediminitomix flava]PWJ44572.1 PAS domain S-box-containing protein [Sediminitomix flava]
MEKRPAEDKVNFWTKLIDPKNIYTIEQKLLIIICFGAAMGCSSYMLVEIPFFTFSLDTLYKIWLPISYAYITYLARYKGKFVVPFILLPLNTLSFAIYTWFTEGGPTGISPMMFFNSVVVFSQVVKPKRYPIVAALYILVTVFLTLDYIDYQSINFIALELKEKHRIVLMIAATPFIGFTTSAFRSSLEDHRKKISVQNQSLKESTQKYQDLVESIQDNVFLATLDQNRRFTYLSPSVKHILGYEQDELHSFDDILIEKFVFGGLNFKSEVEVKGKNGQQLFLNIRIYKHIHENKLIGYECVVQDVTSRVIHERSYEKTIKEQKELNELKSKFLSMVTHQFRTPLSVIQTSVDLIRIRVRKLAIQNLNIDKNTNQIYQALEQLINLMDNLLTLNKIEANKIKFSPSVIDFPELVEKIIGQYKLIQTNGQQVELKIEGEPKPVLMDEKLMENVVSNLISNALKYSKGKQNPISEIMYDEDQLVFKVTDYGIGISESDIPNLFQPFFRANNTDHIKGTGVGLSVVKEFVDIHHGDIQVESEMNKQTTFTLKFPYLEGQKN